MNVVSAVSVIIRVHKPKCTTHLSVSAGDFFCGDDAHFEVFLKIQISDFNLC